jgi:hypothetical protein
MVCSSVAELLPCEGYLDDASSSFKHQSFSEAAINFVKQPEVDLKWILS